APRSASPARLAPERELERKAASQEADATAEPSAQPAPAPPDIRNFGYSRRPAQFGSLAYVVESVECKAAGEVWLRFYQGMVTDLNGDVAQYQLGRRISLWYDPSAIGVNANDWFCVPKRRFCYGDVSFMQWEGKYEAGDRLEVNYPDLENSEDNLLDYAEALAKRHCGE
ncbi:MAG: hypothetical protein KTR21_14835, partial [Rhodobacteraceae bacterium]|nr:hypothetical protein [Paracoccaceae bacterium]